MQPQLRLIEEPDINMAECRIFIYLTTFVGKAKLDDLHLFLRFVTGSIKVTFNHLTGLARRPHVTAV